MRSVQNTASIPRLSRVFKALMVLMLVYTTSVNCSITQQEIDDAMQHAPEKFCGKRLTSAMKFYCTPEVKAKIESHPNHRQVKKSISDFEFESFDLDRIAAENDAVYDDSRPASLFDDLMEANNIRNWPNRRQKPRHPRGIIEECCKRACYKSELIAFCPQKNETDQEKRNRELIMATQIVPI